eukprot:COSAG02_NODE_317_length_24808_cov_120.564329_24_plen_133_part_00
MASLDGTQIMDSTNPVIAHCARLPVLSASGSAGYPHATFCQFKDGFNGTLPPEWDTMDPFSDYGKGSELVDQTCGQMAVRRPMSYCMTVIFTIGIPCELYACASGILGELSDGTQTEASMVRLFHHTSHPKT